MPNSGTSSKIPMPHREIHLKDLVKVVTRHWLLVLVLTALIGGGAYYTSRRTIPQYQSTLTVQINSPKQVFARLDDIDIDEFALRTDPILSEALFLTTNEMALRVATAVGLQLEIHDPLIFRHDVFSNVHVDSTNALPASYTLRLKGADGYELIDGSGSEIASGAYNEAAHGPGFSFNVRPTPDLASVPFNILSTGEATARVASGISYTVRQSTNAVDIRYTGTDPTVIPVVLNSAATELRAAGARRARSIAAQRRIYIYEQTLKADSSFQAKLHEMQAFKERQRITDLSAEEQTIVHSIQQLEQESRLLLVQISTIDDALTVRDTFGIESLNQLAAVYGLGTNAALTFQINNLLQLFDQRRAVTAGALGLRETSPEVMAIDERLQAGSRALNSAVDATRRSLAGRLGAIEEKIAEQHARLATYPGKETRIAQLELEANIINETYRYLLGQYEAARLQEATIAPYVDILDAASVPYGIGTTAQQKVVLGAVVGLLLGLAGAFFLEYLDQTVKTGADIERLLALPVLGRIPENAKLKTRAKGIVTVEHLAGDEPVVESFRALRTNVTFVGAERPVQFIAVTSPGPQEGKTTTATNLAITLSQNGHRTLLIDGDLRRPQAHRALGLVQAPGLTDVLIGSVGSREAIRPDASPNLDFIPSGALPPNPAELLGSDAMRTLLVELRKRYDYIIMDSPPALPVTDATVIATHADATILVLRSGDTEEHAAQGAVRQLQRVRARIAGVVLNGVKSRNDRSYSYYSYSQSTGARSALGSLRSRFANLI